MMPAPTNMTVPTNAVKTTLSRLRMAQSLVGVGTPDRTRARAPQPIGRGACEYAVEPRPVLVIE